MYNNNFGSFSHSIIFYMSEHLDSVRCYIIFFLNITFPIIVSIINGGCSVAKRLFYLLVTTSCSKAPFSNDHVQIRFLENHHFQRTRRKLAPSVFVSLMVAVDPTSLLFS
jgi:hypothetical protein